MLNLKKALRPYTETGALNEQVNLYGFIDPHAFLTKSGDLGVILQVHGVDYECLDGNSLDALTKRLESAFRLFDSNFRIYQYVFKRNHETIPHKKYANPIVNTAIENRIRYFEQKADTLYSTQVFYVVLFEGFHHKQAVLRSLAEFHKNPWQVFSEIRAALSSRKQVALLDTELSKALATLNQKVKSFILQVSDFVRVDLLGKQDAFRVLKRTLNFAPLKLELARLKHDTFLDYCLCESHLECHRGHLRLDDYYVKVLSLKEPSAQSFPLIFKSLLEVQANFHIVTEWKKEDSGKTRKAIQSKRRHFHNTKRSLMSHLNVSDAPATDVLVDDSKEAQVRELGESIKQLEIEGNYFGQFSLSVVIYDLDPAKVETACAEFYKVFSLHDAQLYEEKYNLLNAFLATVPGGSAFNLRSMYLLNTNYADYSFLFTLHCGEPENRHLKQEYLAVLETNHKTPYFLNLHHRDVAHTMILGRTGSGKSFLLNFLITNMQKYDPYTFIFDLGGSFESLTRLFGGTYVRVGLNSPGFKINPFSVAPTKENLDFLALFLKVLIQGASPLELTPSEDRDLYHQIDNLYEIEPALRTLTVLSNTLDRRLADRLAKWTTGGQFDFVFDNSEDTITFSRFQCFDFQGMNQYPEVLEPLLFYILHRANAVICDPNISHIFKAFFIDEAWLFLKNPIIKSYIIEALKTWRKQNAAMILSTQSLDELRKSEILDILIESCPTKIFLANPDMDRDLYRRQFNLNDNEIELICTLRPKQQLLIKTPELAKVANLDVDAKSYWLYTNDPFDNRKRRDAFEAYGFEKGLEVLAGGQP
ncbi:MAG TPA: type IV secretion system DNA-binding domain-containing protein [Candidatus Acidoferrales bacterium]|nr:type IV secretion system DNA-binding domain-containing protein [Candidatus Acidoferrales bacterium]